MQPRTLSCGLIVATGSECREDLDAQLRDRARFGDPMAHLVKQRQAEPPAPVIPDHVQQQMAKSGFVIPQVSSRPSQHAEITPPPWVHAPSAWSRVLLVYTEQPPISLVGLVGGTMAAALLLLLILCLVMLHAYDQCIFATMWNPLSFQCLAAGRRLRMASAVRVVANLMATGIYLSPAMTLLSFACRASSSNNVCPQTEFKFALLVFEASAAMSPSLQATPAGF